MKIKNKIIISFALSALIAFISLSVVSAEESDWYNLNPGLESGLTGTVNNCSPLTVSNGTVAAYPGCAITCNSGYTLSGSSCVASGGGGGGGGYIPPTTTTTTIPGKESACQWCGLACIELQSWMYCPSLTPAAGYICTEINGVCTKTFGVPTATTTAPSGGSTTSSLQGRIAELQAIINNLLKQLGLPVSTTTTVPGATTTTTISSITVSGIPEGFTFKNNLREGMVSEDIRYLQRFLNSHTGTQIASSGLGSPGMETNYFGALTKAAVIKFQNMYTSEVLSQWGLTRGNGYVGQSTRKKLNELLGE